MRRGACFLPLLLLVVVPPAALGAVQCFPVSPPIRVQGSSWGLQSNPASAGPGDANVPLVVQMQNVGGCMIDSLRGTLTPPSAFSDVSGSGTSVAYAIAIPQNSIFQMTFNLNVASSAYLGTYSLPLALLWNSSIFTSTQQANVSVTLRGDVRLLFTTSNTVLYPGQITNLTLTLRNLGTGPASSIDTTVNSPQSVSVLNQYPRVRLLNSSGSFQEVLRIFAPSSAAGSPVSITLSSTYRDSYLNTRSYTQTLGFYVATLQAGVSPITLSVEPKTLVAGKVNNLTITITNSGTSALSRLSVSFTFTSGQLTWLSPDLFQAQSFPAGQTVAISAKAYDPPLSTASTNLQVSLKYYDTNNTLNQETRSVGLLSEGTVELTLVDLSTIPQNPSARQVFSITASLTNTGTITASAVTATPLTPQGFTLFGARSIFVGDMQVNTPTTFTISLFVGNATASGGYTIPIQLTYLDNLRNKLTSTITVSVTLGASTATQTRVAEASPLTRGSLLLVVIAAVIAALVTLTAGYFLGKRSTRR